MMTLMVTPEESEDQILSGGLLDATDPDVRVRLERDLAALQRGELFGADLYKALHDFGEAGLLKAKAEIERHLTHPDPEARNYALTSLVLDWSLQSHRTTAEHFLLHDPDEDNRHLGATCIGHLMAGTQDPHTLKLLCQVIKNQQEEEVVRVGAYHALLAVLGIENEQPTSIELETIDWSIVRSIEE